MTEMLKQEEYQIQQEYENCHQVGRRDSALGRHPSAGTRNPQSAWPQSQADWGPEAYFSLCVYKPVLSTTFVNKIIISGKKNV